MVQRNKNIICDQSNIIMSRDSVVGIVTRLRPERSGDWIPPGAETFCLLRNVQTGSGAHATFYSVGTGFTSRR